MRATRCQHCNNAALVEQDGRQAGGFPGVTYQVCPACGWSRAVTKGETKRERIGRIRQDKERKGKP